MSTVWRCPRCGAVSIMEAQLGDEVVAVYDLCAPPVDPHESRVPVPMERVVDPDEIRGLTARREPVLV